MGDMYAVKSSGPRTEPGTLWNADGSCDELRKRDSWDRTEAKKE